MVPWSFWLFTSFFLAKHGISLPKPAFLEHLNHWQHIMLELFHGSWTARIPECYLRYYKVSRRQKVLSSFINDIKYHYEDRCCQLTIKFFCFHWFVLSVSFVQCLLCHRIQMQGTLEEEICHHMGFN